MARLWPMPAKVISSVMKQCDAGNMCVGLRGSSGSELQISRQHPTPRASVRSSRPVHGLLAVVGVARPLGRVDAVAAGRGRSPPGRRFSMSKSLAADAPRPPSRGCTWRCWSRHGTSTMLDADTTTVCTPGLLGGGGGRHARHSRRRPPRALPRTVWAMSVMGLGRDLERPLAPRSRRRSCR